MKVKVGRRFLLDHAYCEAECYKDGWLHFHVINGGWDGKFSNGTMMVDPGGAHEHIVPNKRITYVFLPGEVAGHQDYNEIMSAHAARRFWHQATRYLTYWRWLLKDRTRAWRIKLAKFIDPRTPREKFEDSDIAF